MRRAVFSWAWFLLLLMVSPSAAQEEPERPDVCIQCHSSLEGALVQPVEEWKTSVHARNGIFCYNCHGGDPTDADQAMSPDRGFRGAPSETEIPAFCGTCHVRVEKDYLESAHGKDLGKGGPQCVTCHGNHAVQRASPDLINPTLCSRCHDYGGPQQIKAAMVQTDETISGLQGELKKVRRVGVAVKNLQDEVFSLRNQFHGLFHTVDVERVRSGTAAIQQKLADVEEKVAAIRERLARRAMLGGVVTALLLLTGVLLLLVRRTYHAEERASSRAEDPGVLPPR